MNRLFLRIYLPVALSLLGTIVLTSFLTFRVAPERARGLHARNLMELREWVIGHPGATPGEILAKGDSLGLGEIRVIPFEGPRPGLQPPMPRPGHLFLPGLPLETGFLLEVPLMPRGREIFTRAAVWGFIMIMLGATAVSLFASLAPLRSRLAGLRKAVLQLGSGDLSARVPAKENGDILDSLGITFNSMAARISDLVGSHQELLGSVAHELRTPLARMRFALEMLRESAGASDSRIEAMERDVSALDALLAELLAFNRLGRSSPGKAEEVDLYTLAREAVEAEGFTHPDKTVEVRGSGSLLCERPLLERAVSNLVRNALQNCRSRVEVSIEGDGTATWLEVSDDGPGFDAALSGRIGRPFVKGSASSGTGLGLATVERIAKLCGGSVTYGRSVLGGAMVKLVVSGEDRVLDASPARETQEAE